MSVEKQGIYLTILRYAILNMRVQGYRGNPEACFVEADHVHNIPEILMKDNMDRENYYWKVERAIYLSKADEYYSSSFRIVWSKLEKLLVLE